MEKHYLFANGLPFDKTLARNLDILRDRINLNKAVLFVIDGNVGEGKTTLGIHVADYLNGAYVYNHNTNKYTLDKSKLIDLKKQFSMGGTAFQENLQICIEGRLNSLLYDEAGDFNRRGSLTKFNQQLNRVFDTMRTFGIPIGIILPSASVLDKALFINGVLRMCINTYGRTKYYGRYRCYSLYRAMYVMDKMKKMVVPQQAYAKTIANFYGQFLDLTPERAFELAKICDEGKKNILSANVLENRGLIPLNKLSDKLGITKQYTNYLLRKTNLKEQSTFKKMRYFDNDVYLRLSGMIKK
jgi:hypothetical protein